MRPEAVRDISKSRLHKLHDFMEKNLGTEMCIKFESEVISVIQKIIAARVIRKRRIEKKIRSYLYLDGEGVELTIHKYISRGNKGSGTDISSCAIYL